MVEKTRAKRVRSRRDEYNYEDKEREEEERVKSSRLAAQRDLQSLIAVAREAPNFPSSLFIAYDAAWTSLGEKLPTQLLPLVSSFLQHLSPQPLPTTHIKHMALALLTLKFQSKSSEGKPQSPTSIGKIVIIRRSRPDIETMLNISSAFAASSTEMEATAKTLQQKLRSLIELDGSSARTLKRFCKGQKENRLDAEECERLARKCLGRKKEQLPLGSVEIRHGLTRYLNPAGVGGVDAEMLQSFCAEESMGLCQVFEHSTWMSKKCLGRDPRVVVDVVCFAHGPSRSESDHLIKDGFERALGYDVGIWVKRLSKSRFETEEEFLRARVTDMLYSWEDVNKETASSLVKLGFLPVQAKNKRKGYLVSCKAPLLWLRRNADEELAVCSVFFSDPQGPCIPPCNDFEVRLSSDINRQSRGIEAVKEQVKKNDPQKGSGSWRKWMVGFTPQMKESSVLFVQKLRCGKSDTGLEALALEFEMLNSEVDKERQRQIKKRHQTLREKRLLESRALLRKHLRKELMDHCLSEQSLSARDLFDSAQMVKLLSKGARGGSLSRTAVEQIFLQIGVEFVDDAVRKEFIESLLDNSTGRVESRKLAKLLEPNPKQVYDTLFELVQERASQLAIICEQIKAVQKPVSGKQVMEKLKTLTQGTVLEFKDWLLKDMVRAFCVTEKESKIESDLFVSVFENMLACLAKKADQHATSKQDVVETGMNSIKSLIVTSFPTYGDPLDNFKAFFSRQGHSGTALSVSLARLKSIIRKTCKISDPDLEEFLSTYKLNTLTFVTPKDMQRVSIRILQQESGSARDSDSGQESHLSDQDDGQILEMEGKEEEEEEDDDQEEGIEDEEMWFKSKRKLGWRKYAGIMHEPERLVGDRHDWTEIRNVFRVGNGDTVKDYLLAQEKEVIPRQAFVEILSKAKIRLSQRSVDLIAQQAEVSHNELFLDRERLLKAIWPQQDIAVVKYHQIDTVLAAAKQAVSRAVEKGVSRKRLINDIILYVPQQQQQQPEDPDDAMDPKALEPTHLVAILKRLVRKAGNIVVDQADLLRERLYAHLRVEQQELGLFDALCSFLFDSAAETQSDEVDGSAQESRMVLARRELLSWLARWNRSHSVMVCFEKRDQDGRGWLTRHDFREALAEAFPNLSHSCVHALENAFVTDENLVKYAQQDFKDLFRARPQEELGKVFAVIARVRSFLQKRLSRRNNHNQTHSGEWARHHWEYFREEDVRESGVLSAEQFRRVAFDALDLSDVMSEKELELIMRWCGSATEFGKIEYQRFCRCIAPTMSSVSKVTGKIFHHIKIASQIGGGQIDLRLLFQRFDAASTGFVTRKEFLEGLAQANLAPHVVSAEDLQVLLDSFDLDGQNRVDYVAFYATVMSCGSDSHDEEHGLLVEIANRVRQRVLAARCDPISVFEQRDKLRFGTVSLDDFLRVCYDLYIPCDDRELVRLVEYMGHATYDGKVVYRDFVQDIIRAGGPGGFLATCSKPLFSVLHRKEVDAVWNVANVQGWLSSKDVSVGQKKKFVELYRGMDRAKHQLQQVSTSSSAATPFKDVEKVEPKLMYNKFGIWTCHVCGFSNARIRFQTQCEMCETMIKL